MKALNNLSPYDKRRIERIEELFNKLNESGVVWEGIDGGGGGTINFMKPKLGINVWNLSKTFEGKDDVERFIDMTQKEQMKIYRSTIKISVTVP